MARPLGILGVAAAASLVGCVQTYTFTPATVDVPARPAARLEVGQATGAGVVRVPVRLVDELGLAVPGTTALIEVQGSPQVSGTFDITLDGMGFGEVVVQGDPQELRVEPKSSADGARPGDVARAWITGGELPTLGVLRGAPAANTPRGLAAPATGGVAYADANALYFQSFDMAVDPVQVAAFDGDIEGMEAAHLDGDGVWDLLVQTNGEVTLLRGKRGYGYGFGAALAVEGGFVLCAAAGDVDNDQWPDLVVGYTVNNNGGVQVLRGTGAWIFEPLPPLETGVLPWDASVAFYEGLADPQVAVLSEDGLLRWTYNRSFVDPAQAWQRDPDDLRITLGDSPELGPSVDLGGDGLAEAVLVGTYVSDAVRDLVLVELVGTTAADIQQYQLPFQSFRYGVADLTGDGTADVVVSTEEAGENQLRLITTDDVSGEYKNRERATTAESGTLAAGDLDDDGVVDVTLLTDFIYAYRGEELPREEGGWGVDESFVSFGLGLVGPWLVRDLVTQDEYVDILAVRSSSGETVLQALTVKQDPLTGSVTYEPRSGGFASVDGGSNGATATGQDMEICDNVAYVLVRDNGVHLHSIRLESDGRLTALASAPAEGDRVTCGSFAGGAKVATLTQATGVVAWYNGSLVKTDTDNVGDAKDLVGVDAGATSTLDTCNSTGCEIIAADLDGDGNEETIVGGDTTTVYAFGTTFPLDLRGSPTAGDVDGDGVLDVIVTDDRTNRMVLYRTLDAAFTPAAWYFTESSVEGGTWFGDMNADGVPEAFFGGPEGTVLLSEPSAP